jgi:adenosylcobinamide-phosphate guanylyltransferase
MCGGRGTRLDAESEKPLFEVGGRPMVDRVRDALVGSRIDTVYAVTSPEVPRTRDHVDGPVVDAPGEGYVTDLRYALERVDPPVLTAAADLPLLAGDAVDVVVEAFAGDSLTVCVPAALKRALGVSIDTTMRVDGREVAPAGLNVVSHRQTEDTLMTHDARFAVNVNRLSDAQVAEDLL